MDHQHYNATFKVLYRHMRAFLLGMSGGEREETTKGRLTKLCLGKDFN